MFKKSKLISMMIQAYALNLLIFIGIYIILAASLNLALGYTGLLNLGHVAFFAIGAYTSALLTQASFTPFGFKIPFLIALLCAGILASVFGLLLVLATRKLKGDYLALTTLGFSFVISSLLINWQSLTRGPLGITGITKPLIFGILIKSNLSFFIFTAIICILSLLIIYGIVHSPFGRLLQALRDDELGLSVLGKNTTLLKIQVMMISAFFAAIAGSLFAHYITYIDPSSFTIPEIVLLLTIVIVGGIASLKGTILATVILFIIPEVLRFVHLSSSIIGPLRQILYAVLLLAILLLRPKGIFGQVDLQ